MNASLRQLPRIGIAKSGWTFTGDLRYLAALLSELWNHKLIRLVCDLVAFRLINLENISLKTERGDFAPIGPASVPSM